MNRLSLILCFLLLSGSAGLAVDAPSGQRVALLIGNSDYGDFRLRGVAQSLDTVEQSLKSRGFEVQRQENLTTDDQKKLTFEFARSVPTNGVAVIYYIGLAAHVQRFDKMYNVLRPVKAQIGSDNDYRSRGLNVAELTETLRKESGARTSLLFLDACWDSPIRPEKGMVHSGLTEFEVGADTTVVFAAESRKRLPVPQKESPTTFAESLAKNLAGFDESLEKACGTMPGWSGGIKEGGLGTPSAFPVADSIRDGNSSGEGFVNSVGMSLRWCPPGKFQMGSSKTDSAATRDRKAVEVTLTKGFWMGEHEVTQREYNLVMRKNPPLGFTVHRNAPFWGITEAKTVNDFCKKLNDLEKKAGKLPSGWEYVCPTEAEWEYACRAGSKSAFCFGDSAAELGEYANFADQTLHSANPNYYWAERKANDGVAEALALVGSYRPNAWGLRDMHGNVAEVVADHLLPELPGGKDPLARVEKNGRTQIRGGGWCSQAAYCESSFRNSCGRDKSNYVGFRIALKKVK